MASRRPTPRLTPCVRPVERSCHPHTMTVDGNFYEPRAFARPFVRAAEDRFYGDSCTRRVHLDPPAGAFIQLLLSLAWLSQRLRKGDEGDRQRRAARSECPQAGGQGAKACLWESSRTHRPPSPAGSHFFWGPP